jgi:arylsulfatase A-like enzyme
MTETMKKDKTKRLLIMNTAKKQLFLSACFGLSGTLFGTAEPAKQRPNFVLIVADDLGCGNVSILGGSDIPTPHIDSVGKDGVIFSDGYASGPLCVPSRAGLITGRYQQRFGHEVLFWNKDHNVGLPVGEKTMADRLKAAGYITGMVGKWHLGKEECFFPMNRGFMEFFGDPGHGSPYLPHPETGQVARPWNQFYRNHEKIEIREHITDVYAREAVEFIDRNQGNPFFLYMAFTAPHMPLESTQKYLDRFPDIENTDRRTYAAMISAMDDGVGRILQELQKHGLEKNTLVVFLSDNGALVPPGDNGIYRERKGRLLEGGIRVPFFAKWPAKLPAGSVYDNPVIALDVAPMFYAAAGINIKPEWELDGVDLLPYLTGEKKEAPHERLYWRLWRTGPDKQLCAIREGDWKLVTPSSPGSYGDPRGEPDWALYNLRSDPGEQEDLSGRYPERTQRMAERWGAWDETLMEPLWCFE